MAKQSFKVEERASFKGLSASKRVGPAKPKPMKPFSAKDHPHRDFRGEKDGVRC